MLVVFILAKFEVLKVEVFAMGCQDIAEYPGADDRDREPDLDEICADKTILIVRPQAGGVMAIVAPFF